ncbi:MAG: 16S rRNA (guanine(966)-N(2))-methyltransferase RsmD [Armatimonadetes bacterium]|nr:16S rRNA (guanine(966)-N(2))-methyltransferase RsmD [Armatimonadota bacterium]
MRVIAGEAKSLRLIAPKGVGLRPTSDAVREALFSSLGSDVVGARFLDVYAGTGAVGIEALSRGAEFCAFVERDRRCVEAIRRNLGNTRLSARAAVVQGDARRVIGRVLAEYGPFGLVFADPPYDDASAAEVAKAVLGADGFAEPGWLIYQHSKDAPPGGLPTPVRTRAFGETAIAWFALPVKGD